MSCMSCDGSGYVTVEMPCKDPDNCIDGGPTSGIHQMDVVCPCCGDEDDDEDDDGLDDMEDDD